MSLVAFPTNQLNDLKGDLRLADSGLTASWLLDTLWQQCPEFRTALGSGKVLQIDADDISEGKGYGSKVYKTVLKFSDAPTNAYTVMVKVPTTECMQKMREKMSNNSEQKDDSIMVDPFECHNVECQTYEQLRGLDLLPLPTVWYTQQVREDCVGAILMQDLAVDATTLGFVCSLTLQQVQNIMKHLAAFHKYQLYLCQEELSKWTSIPSASPFWVNNLMGDHILGILDNNVPEFREGEMKELIAKYRPCISKEFSEYALVTRPKQLGLPLLFCHGDTGPHNMFFKKAPDGTPSNDVAAFIDWQIPFIGNQMFDIARILYTFCDAEVRREAELTLVDDYYRLLNEGMAKDGRKLDFDVEELREAFALAGIHQTMMALCCPAWMEAKRSEYPAGVFDAWRQKFLLRAKLTVRDAIASLEKYAPQFIGKC